MSAARQGRRPWLVPTLFTGPALILLVGLGVWQLQRLDWKTGLIAARRAALAAAPIALPEANGWPAGAAYLKVQARGRFSTGRNLYIGPRRHREQAGVHVLTPFRLADGRHVLVDRGFLAGDGRAPVPWQDRLDDRPRKIVGILRRDLARARFSPDNVLARNEWYWFDLPAMGKALGVDLSPALLVLSPVSDRPGPPEALAVEIDLPNNHLQYAATWFAFAFVLAVIYGLYLKRARRGG